MPIAVRNKNTDHWLRTPIDYGGGVQCWDWSDDKDKAHQFPDRAAAKKLLRELRTGRDIKDYTFHQVGGTDHTAHRRDRRVRLTVEAW